MWSVPNMGRENLPMQQKKESDKRRVKIININSAGSHAKKKKKYHEPHLQANAIS